MPTAGSTMNAVSLITLLSLATIPLLLVALIPLCLPRKMTGMPPSQSHFPARVSTLIFALLNAATSISHWLAHEAAQPVTCTVDAGIEVYMLTTLVAHLPLCCLKKGQSLPSPSPSEFSVPSASRTALQLMAVYIYGALPLVPIIFTAPTFNAQSTGQLAVWWGTYCIPTTRWWRIVRAATLLPPLLLTAVLCLVTLADLYSNMGHPYALIRPSGKDWALTMYLQLGAMGGICYLIAEQIVGWQADWWPRAIEAILPMLIFLPYSFSSHIWRPYSFWLRGKRPLLHTPRSSPEPLKGTLDHSSKPKLYTSYTASTDRPLTTRSSFSALEPAMLSPVDARFIPLKTDAKGTRATESGRREL